MWFLLPAIGSFTGRSIASSIGREIAAQAVMSSLRGGGTVPRIHIQHNFPDAARWFRDQEKQARYATAVALTRTAKQLVPIMENEVRRSFDSPTNFVVRGFGSTSATKARLFSTVFIKRRQAEILRPHIVGGGRSQKPFERKMQGDTGADGFWTPGAGVRLNAAGNLTKAQIAKIVAGLKGAGKYADVFVGKPIGRPHAPFGIWGRPKIKRRGDSGKLVPLLIKVERTNYRRTFDFEGVAKRHAQRIFNEEFECAFKDAQRSIRPISPP